MTDPNAFLDSLSDDNYKFILYTNCIGHIGVSFLVYVWR